MRLEEKAAGSRYQERSGQGGTQTKQPNSRTGFFSGFEEDNTYE
jgi:hypothetical protein